jgi:hypothetical protein
MKRIITLAALASVGTTTAEAHYYDGCKKNPCKRHVLKPYKAKVLRIATCESNQRWHLRNGYEGGMQFSPGTWDDTGSRYSAAYYAPPLEQMYRAVVWFHKIGTWVTTAGWPVCGYR